MDSGRRAGRAPITRLVNHYQVRGVGAARQVAGQIGHPDADKDSIAVFEQARGIDGH